MKTTIFSALFASVISTVALAQDVTTVNATSAEISDNLDLRAVASIFGDAANLEDFERKLNDPEYQISNLDLNNDNRVDYIRVIETVDRNTHLIVLQSVLGQDMFQDVATIEVERDSRNNVQVQVVGDVYMYGPNYIYEPVYVQQPVIYTTFWVGSYHPYHSGWYWNYYPSYYYAWNPYPVFRYRRNVHVHINTYNHYNYVNVRRSDRAVALYNGRRSDAYARQYPNRSFQQRHANVANRYELDQKRKVKDVGTRNGLAANSPRSNGTRNNTPRTQNNAVRNASNTPRSNSGVRSESTSVRSNSGVRTTDNSSVRSQTQTPRNNGNVRSNENTVRTESSTPRNNGAIRSNDNANSIPRNNGAVRSNDNASVRSQSSMPRENSNIRTPSNTQRENRMQRTEPSQSMQRAQQAPRANRVENAAPRGNGGGNAQMANNRQGGERRGSESRR